MKKEDIINKLLNYSESASLFIHDSAGFDMGNADVIMQQCMFGEVIYG